MAEAVGALYAVETVAEGAAIGVLAVAQSTAPLHLSFRKIHSPTNGHELARCGHTVNVVRGKAYIIGGEQNIGGVGTIVALTLPVASSTGGEGTLEPQDFQIVSPELKSSERPLAQQTSLGVASSRGGDFNRIGHSSTAIDDKLFIVGGGSSSDGSAHSFDKFVVFDTLTNTYNILEADVSSCVDGIPPPRISHSATSSPLPPAGSLADGPTVDAYGTIFIHGGRRADVNASQSKTLRDTWVFDIGSRAWAKLPDIPDPGPSEIAGEGRIISVNNRLWRLGDGFGRVMYLNLNDSHSAGAGSQLSVALKDGVKWEAVNFGTAAVDGGSQGKTSTTTPTSQQMSLPLPRVSSGIASVTTGAGREYLIYFMGRDSETGPLDDFWSFQIDAERNTAASIKDKVRDAIAGDSTSSWKSGRHTWAKCQQGEEGEAWPPGLHDFGSDVWSDQGRDVFLIWGGTSGGHDRSQGEVVDGGWVVTVQ